AMRRDFQVETLRPVTQRYTYDARSFPRFSADLSEAPPPRMTRINDEAGNPRARRFATELRAQYADDRVLIDALLRHFREEEFFYTLSPATLGANPVDEFLFDTREGFCEHYA